MFAWAAQMVGTRKTESVFRNAAMEYKLAWSNATMEMMYLMTDVMNANSNVSWNASYATWESANFVLKGC